MCRFCTNCPDGHILSCSLSQAALLTTLNGIATATNASPALVGVVQTLILSAAVQCGQDVISLWREILSTTSISAQAQRLARTLLAVSLLKDVSYHPEDHDRSRTVQEIWGLLHAAITGTDGEETLEFKAQRSAQGFLSVALCSVIEQGQIQELIRFHVWLPDGMRGVDELAVHAHQPWAQSWILAGRGTDLTFDVRAIDGDETSSRSEDGEDWQEFQEHVPRWFSVPVAADEKTTQDSTYKTHQTSSKVVPNGRYVVARKSAEESHSRDMTYSVPAGAFHRSVVPGDEFHATLFFFDAKRGFEKDAAVLGPKEGKQYVQVRDPAGTTPKELAEIAMSKRLEEQSAELESNVVRYCREAIYDRWFRMLNTLFSRQKTCEVTGRTV